VHEEFLRAPLNLLIAEVAQRPRRGEITLLIGGCVRSTHHATLDHPANAIASDETDT
jgi:hypothetical protein